MDNFNTRRTWGPKPKYESVLRYRPPNTDFILIAGPCSVEDKVQINEVAKIVAGEGGTHLRGGVFRAGTYPGNNFGLVDYRLIEDYANAAAQNGLQNIIEVLDVRMVERLGHYSTAFQVGCRQMQNYTLLRELGKYQRQVFLKRSTGATLDEFLGAAEHLLHGGYCEPVLIERGSSTHHSHVRWDLSISMIPAIKNITKIPIICDASHGTGRRDLVAPMARAGIAAGADGVLIEVHPKPTESLSDADQAIAYDEFSRLGSEIRGLRSLMESFKKARET